MKLSEKVLIVLYVAFFLLQGLYFPFKVLSFWFLSYLLSGLYLFGGYYLFNEKSKEVFFIPILAGIAFSLAIPGIYHNIRLQNSEILNLLPVLNILFFFGLLFYLLLQRNRKQILKQQYFQILIRSGIILVISCFFSYGSIRHSSVYQTVLIYLNSGIDDLVSNIKMFHYKDLTEKYIEERRCDEAIEASLRSFEEGRAWLGLHGPIFTPEDQLEMLNIQGTYTNAYEAYKCKASNFYDKKDYQNALYFYSKADSFLNINPIENIDYWHKIRSQSKDMIGLCYYYLSKYDSANSNHLNALEYYNRNVENKHNITVASYYFNLSKSITKQNRFNEANQVLEMSIPIIKEDSLNEENKKELVNTYLQMASNSLLAEDFIPCRNYLNHSVNYINDVDLSFSYCRYLIYSSILHYKQDQYHKSLEMAQKALQCFESESKPDEQTIAGSHLILFETNMALAKFDTAKLHLDKALAITKINHSPASIEYHEYLERMAAYYFKTGNYRKSKDLYHQVQNKFEAHLGVDDSKLTEVHSALALIHSEEAKYKLANVSVENCNRIMKINEMFDLPSSSYNINKIAYIKYLNREVKLADSLYHFAIQLTLKNREDSILSVAESLNGLALIELSKRNYRKADNLFNTSLKLQKDYLTEDHPHTAIVLMNIGELKLYEKEFEASELNLQKSLNIFQRFYKKDHPNIADNYLLLGELSLARTDFKQAKIYLNQSFQIYQEHFDEDHEKVLLVKKILSGLN